jgi:hypothetical protein
MKLGEVATDSFYVQAVFPFSYQMPNFITINPDTSIPPASSLIEFSDHLVF